MNNIANCKEMRLPPVRLRSEQAGGLSDWHIYPLDESGNRRDEIEVASSEDKAKLILGPKHKTVWYEVVIR